MICLALVGAVIGPAFVASREPEEPPQRAQTAVVLPPSAGVLRSCAALAGRSPCLTELAGVTAEAHQAAAAPESAPAPATDLAAESTPEPEPLPTMDVREGDTLFYIADWFGLTPWDIAFANAISVDDYLLVGQVLAIPVAAAEFAVPPAVAIEVYEEPAEDLALAYVAPEPAAPQPTPTPTPRPYVPPPSSEEVIAAICSFPWPCDQMVRIASCESGLNPSAVNPAGYYGLFQIAGYFDGWDDPWINSSVAYYQKYLPALAKGDGLTPWPVCRYY